MHIFCLDFDGVICDSAPETAVTAWKVCQKIWPGQLDYDVSPGIIERFCRLRPVIETGYETIALMRLIQDTAESDETIFASFPTLRESIFAQEQLEPEQLKVLFATTRDDWIGQNEQEWLTWNRFYPGVPEVLALLLLHQRVLILTTKQKRYVTRLFQSRALTFPEDSIFDLDEKRPKKDILLDVKQDMGTGQIHFVEDRLETLLSVLQSPELQDVKLYLANWGYNTPQQRQQAGRIERIRVWSLEQFLGECQKILSQS